MKRERTNCRNLGYQSTFVYNSAITFKENSVEKEEEVTVKVCYNAST